ncbi:hypothetical protein TNCV_2362471 [Trichonephila clavipes]|nr:hypothetical protein TNCV_2362471 [Trichonephila clavipes]
MFIGDTDLGRIMVSEEGVLSIDSMWKVRWKKILTYIKQEVDVQNVKMECPTVPQTFICDKQFLLYIMDMFLSVTNDFLSSFDSKTGSEWYCKFEYSGNQHNC